MTFQQLDKLDKGSKIAKTISDAGLGEPDDYYIMQLLIDFTSKATSFSLTGRG